jgi:predicted protein tyrosine phosphatase
MKFLVVSRREIEHGIVVRTPYVVISISDPKTKRPQIRKPAGFRGALYLKFHDSVPSQDLSLPPDVVVMSEKDGKRIWKFVLGYRDQVGTVVVHCEQGMSRSPAVAAALCKVLGTNSQRFFRDYQPNEYIYDLMASCLPG